MNRIIITLVVSMLIMSCGSSASEEMEIFTIDPPLTNPSFKGSFVSDAHPTSGMVEVSNDKNTLYFKNFKTDNGPKLLVYLTTDLTATDFVNLGDLKGVEGNYNYAVPENTDMSKHKFVMIWCVDFLVSFGHAELK